MQRRITSFHTKPRKCLKRTSFKRKTPLQKPKIALRRTKLRLVGHSTTAEQKTEIQAILRTIVIIRDGGCWLRNYPQAGKCGGRRNDGELILQAEHLHSRAHAISFSDSRLVVCICLHHHIHWKKQYPDLYNQLAEDFIGEERTKLWKLVRNDYRPHKVDLKLELVALKKELSHLQEQQKRLK